MNLLDRNYGLITLLALLLFSCEEPNEIGLSLNPEDQVGVYYVELPVEASMVYVDSINTIQGPEFLAGSYDDPIFGNVYAEAYSQVALNPANLPDDATYDSISLSLKASYFYGSENSTLQRFSVHLLTDSLYLDATKPAYYGSQTMPYQDQPLGSGEFTFDFREDSTGVQRYRNDTLTMPLDNLFGQDLFNRINTNSALVQDQDAFNDYIYGVAIKGDPQNQAVVGFGTDGGCYMTLHYHTGDGSDSTDIRTMRFTIGGSTTIRFNHIEADRTTGVLPSVPLYEEFSANGMIYGQSGTGLMPKLKFDAFRDFSDSVGSFVLNKAEIVLKGIETSSEELRPPSTLRMYITDESNLRKVFTSAGTAYYGVVQGVYGNPATPFDFNYNDYNDDYLGNGAGQGNATVYFTTLKEGGLEEDDILVYPAAYTSSVNHFIVDPEDIKLRLYYTKLKDTK